MTIEPDEVYNPAAQSHVLVSFDEPVHTGDTTGMGSMRSLEATGSSAHCRRIRRPRRRYRRLPPQNELMSLPAVTVWRRQGLFVLGDPQLLRSVRDCSPLTALVQSRITAAR